MAAPHSPSPAVKLAQADSGRGTPEAGSHPDPAWQVDLVERAQDDSQARSRLFELVYEELRAVARGYLANERASHTLQPTALVNEAWLRLEGRELINLAHRGDFVAVAAQAMRRILVDHARARGCIKRGGDATPLDLDPLLTSIMAANPAIDIVALDDALEQLKPARLAQVAELRLFAGLQLDEIGERLSLSFATVKRDWSVARTRLRKSMDGQ